MIIYQLYIKYLLHGRLWHIVKRERLSLHHTNYIWPYTGVNYLDPLYVDFFIQLAVCISGFSPLQIQPTAE